MTLFRMDWMFNRLVAFVFYFIFLVSNMLLGLLFDIEVGAIYGGIWAMFLMYLIYIFGEKIVLVFAKARYVNDDEQLINTLKNFSIHTENSGVKIYWSNVFINNIYYAKSFKGSPVIIIGKNLYSKLNKNEFNSLLYASLKVLKRKSIADLTAINIIVGILFLPVFLFIKFFVSKKYVNYFRVLIYPAFYLKRILHEKILNRTKVEDRIFSMENLKKDYSSALFKIQQEVSMYEMSFSNLILGDLCLTHNKEKDVFWNMLNEKEDFEVTLKSISKS